jgi:hypothetical protein
MHTVRMHLSNQRTRADGCLASMYGALTRSLSLSDDREVAWNQKSITKALQRSFTYTLHSATAETATRKPEDPMQMPDDTA